MDMPCSTRGSAIAATNSPQLLYYTGRRHFGIQEQQCLSLRCHDDNVCGVTLALKS